MAKNKQLFMQKILISVVTAFAVFFCVSCNEDRGGTVGGSAQLIGTWEYWDYGYTDAYERFTFNSKGGFTEEWGEIEAGKTLSFGSDSGTYRCSGKYLIFKYKDDDEEWRVKYEIDGNMLYLDDEGDIWELFRIR